MIRSSAALAISLAFVVAALAQILPSPAPAKRVADGAKRNAGFLDRVAHCAGSRRRCATSILSALVVIGSLFLTGCAKLPPAVASFVPMEEGQRVVYRGATLIDGTGAPPRPNMAVITNGERIEAVLTVAQLTDAHFAGAAIVDLSGRYLLPGLIDSHQHLATPPNRRRAAALMRRHVYGGVTALRIMADDLRSIAELAREARTGEIAAPDLYFAAVAAGPSFFDDPRTQAISAGWTPGTTPWAQAVDEATDIPLAVARARGTGATALKIYANLPPPLVRALAAEARRQGLEVWTHASVFPTSPAEVIAAAPDVISHTCSLAYQLSDPPPQSYQQRFPVDAAALASGDHPVMAGLFREMRQRGIVLDATLYFYQAVERTTAVSSRPPYCTLDTAARLTDQARREGVVIAAGTDADSPPSALLPALYDELELLVSRAGFSPAEAIRAATATAALAAGQETEMGTVEPDKLANLLVVRADPLADIANLRDIAFTVKRGRRFDRSDYRTIGGD